MSNQDGYLNCIQLITRIEVLLADGGTNKLGKIFKINSSLSLHATETLLVQIFLSLSFKNQNLFLAAGVKQS